MVAMLKDLNTYNNLFILRLKRYIINNKSSLTYFISFNEVNTFYTKLSDLFGLSQNNKQIYFLYRGFPLSTF
jgi:hypothetical protein